MRKHRSASGITAFNSMIYAAGGMNIVKLFFFKIQNDSTDSEPGGKRVGRAQNLKNCGYKFVLLFYQDMMGIAYLNRSSVTIHKMVIIIFSRNSKDG